MSLSLAELQARFSQALRYQASGEECNVVGNQFSAEDRVQIYRNNFVTSLSEVLQTTYPMVFDLVGEECFSQLARQYVLTYPLQQGDVTYYGEKFTDIFPQFPNVISTAPYLTEVARFEWTIDLSSQHFSSTQQPASLIPLSKLGDIEESEHGRVQLSLSAGVETFESNIAVFSLQQAIKNADFDGLNINQPECGVIRTLANGESWCYPSSREVIELIDQLHYKKSLSEIEPHLLNQLQTLIGLNLIQGFTLSS